MVRLRDQKGKRPYFNRAPLRKFIKEFKDFAIKGNMIDMAIGIIIGTAFNEVVNTLVKRVIMPPLSVMTNNASLTDLKYVLVEKTAELEEVSIGYGELLEVLVDFLIIAFTIFVVIKFINRLRVKAEDPKNVEEVTPKNIALLARLEELLEEQNEILRNSNN